jgi:putative FmdB family regulatory protein
MPTYEYQCPEGHEFELFQKMSEKPRAKCPVCGRVATRMISGGAGLVFKGSGFYITDYGKDGKGPRKAEKAEGAEKAGAAESSAPKAEKSDSTPKPDSKPDSAPAKTPKPHKKKAAE